MGFFMGPLGKQMAELRIGDRASFTRRVTKQEILTYMGLSGDLNPLYADTVYAGRTPYGSPIVPANLLAGFAQGAVATVLPGRGSVTLAHSYRLLEPARAEDDVTAQLEVTALDPVKGQVTVSYQLANQTGVVLLTGEMVVEPPPALRPILEHAYEQF